MKLKENIRLTDVIDINTLCKIQEFMSKYINVPQITVDADGNPVGKISNFTPFCNLIRSSEKGRQRCIQCDRQAGLLAVKLNQARRIYRCHTGLMDCVAPIIVNGIFLGSVLGGQVLIEGEQTRDDIDIERLSRELDIPFEELEDKVKYIPVVSYQYLEDAVDCYMFLSNYIAQLGMNKLVQDQFIKESQEKFELERKTKKMELKVIQAQINPHFLFNTLNTIARMALIENAPQTEDLIYKLSDFLRYNLKNIEEFPKIKDEIENVKRYLSIQSLRYSDRITYEIHLDEKIMEYRIPSMTLQPIVENSMVHGLETKKEGGKVVISGQIIDGNKLEIKVSDNGNGIKPDVLNLINRQMNGETDQELGIGLLNTHNRIKHYFGKEYGLKIESELNKGTTVYIYLPRKT